MIADSTYDTGELVSRPLAGAPAGVAAAALILGVLAALDGPGAVRAWLTGSGAVLLPASLQTPAILVIVGGIAHFGVGSLLGALYAACQQRTTTSGLFVVGVFYGFIVWLVGYLVLARLFATGPALLPTWSGLLVMVAYGLVMAAWAARVQRASARLVKHARPVD